MDTSDRPDDPEFHPSARILGAVVADHRIPEFDLRFAARRSPDDTLP